MKEIFRIKELVVLVLSFIGVAAQHKPEIKEFGKFKERCCTVEYETALQKQDPNRAGTETFEAWLAPCINQLKNNTENARFKRSNRVIRIPVVVHVIHNGQNVGVGPNIPEGQVLSQIQVLNEDFRRMPDTPGFNDNPVGADIEIEFCLAKRTPDGLPTNGINRVNTGVQGYSSINQIEKELKPATFWDTNRYLNIWVINFEGGDENWGKLMGYAQFPTVQGLTGLSGSMGFYKNDGVVMRYSVFGASRIYPEGNYGYDNMYEQGRTTTHEIGHWLGLRHVWGDGGCEIDDFCEDTPNSAAPNYSCTITDSCAESRGFDMIKNYMNYTQDLCMNMFTKDQKYRMQAVMENAPRRAILKYSDACVPVAVGLDGAIGIHAINVVQCSDVLEPAVGLKNNGTNTIGQAVIRYGVDGANTATFNWSGTLKKNEGIIVKLPSVTVAPGEHTFYARLESVNGVEDAYQDNNEAGKEFATSFDTKELQFTLQRDNFGSETTWSLTNSEGEVLYSGGPYYNLKPGTFQQPVEQTWHIPANGCYTFTIKDKGGDGISGNGRKGSGYYFIKTPDQTIVATGGNFREIKTHRFVISADSLKINHPDSLGEIVLYPNPVHTVLNISNPLGYTLPDRISLYNSLGQSVINVAVRSKEDMVMDVSGLHAGMYFVKINKGETFKILKIIKK